MLLLGLDVENLGQFGQPFGLGLDIGFVGFRVTVVDVGAKLINLFYELGVLGRLGKGLGELLDDIGRGVQRRANAAVDAQEDIIALLLEGRNLGQKRVTLFSGDPQGLKLLGFKIFFPGGRVGTRPGR